MPANSPEFANNCLNVLGLTPIFLRAFDGRIHYWSRGAEQLYGWPAENAVGRFAHELLKTEFPEPLDEILEEFTGKGWWAGTLRQRRHDGSPMVVASFWSMAEGDPDLVIEDNQEIASLPENPDCVTLRRLNDDLEQFTFAAAHDLQEPLRTIRMYAELLRLDEGAKSPDKLDVIISAADRMQDLLRELMGYVEAVKIAPDPGASTDANEACFEALQNLEQMIHGTNAEIGVGPLPVVAMERVRLTQVFQNLVSNAIKYCSPDRPLRLRIWAERRDGRCVFALADNGLGIRPEYQQSIFEAFKRGHTTKIPGTGLGLALCRRILELYGGKVWVESQVDQGSTFYFDVPAEL